MSETISEKEHESIEEHEHKDDALLEVEAREKETEAVMKRVVVRAIEQHSGPIPHPDIIKQYEEILPGAADRIISMAENQSSHRQAMEKSMCCSGLFSA